MKEKSRNYLKILLVILLASGLIYAFYNVLSGRVQGQENRKSMEKVSNAILKSVNQSERMECKSSVYLKLEEEEKQDKAQDMNIVHDFVHQRVQVGRGDRVEIFEYEDEAPVIYSKGVSPVYNKADSKMWKAAKDQWYKYPTEKMYGEQWRRGECGRISYGYLTDEKFIRRIKKDSNVKVGEETYTKYRAIIGNTLRDRNSGEESDNEFRKTLSTYGLNVMNLKKGYPEVYKMLRDLYNQVTEEIYIWVDKDGNMTTIEKDYTFMYYLEVMKENSERIEEKVGQYGYPRVYCRQEYTYNPVCKRIELPKDFQEF